MHEFITALPQGYRTELGERGAHVSAASASASPSPRISQKRAHSSSMSPPAPSIQDRSGDSRCAGSLMAGRTTLMIAHRLSTVRGPIDPGPGQRRCCSEGTHEELMADEGLYRQLYEMRPASRGRAPRLKWLQMFAEVQ